VTTCWGAPRRAYDTTWNGLRTGDRACALMLVDKQNDDSREPLVGGLSRFVHEFLLPARQTTFSDGTSSTLSEQRD
jgi:hypothetical protein